MKKKTLRKLLKEQRKQQAERREAPGFMVPAEFKDRLVRMFLADPGRFAGNPREFAWRQLKQSAEARRRAAG